MKNSASFIFRAMGSVALLLLTAVPGKAEDSYRKFTVSPVLGIFRPGNLGVLKTGYLSGVKIDTQLNNSFTIEGDASLVRSSSKMDGRAASIYLVSLQTLYPILERQNLMPFLTFGVGGIVSVPGEAGPFIDFGLGAKYFITDNLAMRGDLRDVVASGMGNNIELTIGVSFLFGFGSKEVHKISWRRMDGVVLVGNRPSLPVGRIKKIQEAKEKDGQAPPVASVTSVAASIPTPIKVEKSGLSLHVPIIPPPAENWKVTSNDRFPVATTLAATAASPAEAIRLVSASDQKGAPVQLATVAPLAPAVASVEVEQAVRPLLEKNIEFSTGSVDILPSFFKVRKSIALFMKYNSRTTALIKGYADNIGPAEYNLDLSRKRALTLKDQLAKKYGISSTRINIEGFGSTSPVGDNTTVTGRQRNRRAVTLILE